MVICTEKNTELTSPHRVALRVRVQVPKIFSAMNCMKCVDLYRKDASNPHPIDVGGQVSKISFARKCMNIHTNAHFSLFGTLPYPKSDPQRMRDGNMIFLCRSAHFMQFIAKQNVLVLVSFTNLYPIGECMIRNMIFLYTSAHTCNS